MINAQITFVNNLLERHQFFNTVYFLPAHVENDNMMNMLELTWIDATGNKMHSFQVESRISKNKKTLQQKIESAPLPLEIAYQNPQFLHTI